VTPAGKLKELFDQLHEMTDTEQVMRVSAEHDVEFVAPNEGGDRNGDRSARTRGVGAAIRAFRYEVRPTALPLRTEAVGKSRGGVSLVPDLVSGAIVGATVRRCPARRGTSRRRSCE
jgi:hypothetical protein